MACLKGQKKNEDLRGRGGSSGASVDQSLTDERDNEVRGLIGECYITREDASSAINLTESVAEVVVERKPDEEGILDKPGLAFTEAP